jgi:hypothetical protein
MMCGVAANISEELNVGKSSRNLPIRSRFPEYQRQEPKMHDKDKMPPEPNPRDPRVPENKDMPTRPEEADEARTGEKVEEAFKDGLVHIPPG